MKAVDFILFQAAWFACVLGAAWGMPWTGVVLVAVTMPLRWRGRTDLPREAACVAGGLALGLALDGTLRAAGLVAFPAHATTAGLVPAWMSALWVNLAAAMRGSLAFLRGRYLLAVLFGVIGGPLAYLAGMRLGAIEVAPGWQAPLALAAGWGAAMALLLRLAWPPAAGGTHAPDAPPAAEGAA